MERSEAEAIYGQGREPVVDALLMLSARLEAQDAQLVALAERVEELERRLRRDSSSSSLPPSHDPPWLGKRGRARGTGRKAGGQPGHTGHGRSPFPMEQVTEVVEHWPKRCSCGHIFREEEHGSAGAPARHQVAELPPLAVEISEHRLRRLCCPDCGRTVRAELPAGAPDRGKAHLHGLIGEGFSGVVGSDRFTAYNSLEPERRQVCWSHLRRDFTFHADLGSGPQEAF